MLRAMLRAPRRLLLLLTSLALSSCLSPTLPLPPPSRPDVSAPDAGGYVRLQGVAAPDAEVLAWNHNNDLIAGQVTGDDSRYDFMIAGESGDFIELWYVRGTDESQSIRLTVPDAEPSE
jgi:hypothetical protein